VVVLIVDPRREGYRYLLHGRRPARRWDAERDLGSSAHGNVALAEQVGRRGQSVATAWHWCWDAIARRSSRPGVCGGGRCRSRSRSAVLIRS